MSTLLVTGACGFIGSNFVHHVLSRRPESKVVAVDNLSPTGNLANLDSVRDRIELEVCDICDYDAMLALYERCRPDYVVNFAAESHNDRAIVAPTSFARTNGWGTQILLEVSRNVPVRRHLQVSTIEVYGEMPAGVEAFREGSPLNAKTPYSAAKAAGDLFVRAYMQTYPKMDIVMTHCANNYGPYQFPEKLIPVAITNVLQGKPVPIYGDGLQKRDWLHVEDHCAALLGLLEAPRFDFTVEEAVEDAGKLPIYDISARQEKTNLEIVRRIIELLGRDPGSFIEHVADRPNHDRRYLIDPAKLEREMNWRPRVPFDEGLKSTVDWYVKNENWWRDILQRHQSLQFDWSKTTA